MRTWMMIVSSAVLSTAVLGQPAEKPAGPPVKPAVEPVKPAAEPAKPATPPTAQPSVFPSLDEALGLSDKADKPLTKPPVIDDALNKALQGDAEKGADPFGKAVELMKSSAERLEKSADTSVDVQRMQEETIRLLDALVKKGKKQKPKPNSGSKPQEGEQSPESQPNQSPQSQQALQPMAGEPSEDATRGGSTNTRLRPALEASRAAWGNLPQRVRQLLMQGSGDQFSKEYQRLTEEYYKRLGEQGN